MRRAELSAEKRVQPVAQTYSSAPLPQRLHTGAIVTLVAPWSFPSRCPTRAAWDKPDSRTSTAQRLQFRRHLRTDSMALLQAARPHKQEHILMQVTIDHCERETLVFGFRRDSRRLCETDKQSELKAAASVSPQRYRSSTSLNLAIYITRNRATTLRPARLRHGPIPTIPRLTQITA
jgi:hypothetical protein